MIFLIHQVNYIIKINFSCFCLFKCSCKIVLKQLCGLLCISLKQCLHRCFLVSIGKKFDQDCILKASRARVGEVNGTPLQYSGLENPMNGGAWQAAVHGVAKSRTRLSDFTFTLHCHALEKEMTTYSSVLAWRIPGMGEPGGLPSMGSHRVGHN